MLKRLQTPQLPVHGNISRRPHEKHSYNVSQPQKDYAYWREQGFIQLTSTLKLLRPTFEGKGQHLLQVRKEDEVLLCKVASLGHVKKCLVSFCVPEVGEERLSDELHINAPEVSRSIDMIREQPQPRIFLRPTHFPEIWYDSRTLLGSHRNLRVFVTFSDRNHRQLSDDCFNVPAFLQKLPEQLTKDAGPGLALFVSF